MKNSIFFLILLITFSIASIKAQTPYDKKAFRHERVRQGLKTGQLDRVELRQIRQDYKILKYAKKQALVDGKVSRNEHRRISRMERQLDRQIYCSRHNKLNRFSCR